MSPKFEPGHVVYFHHLHDSRRAKILQGPDQNGEYEYLVEGKARRMLVIGLKDRIWLETAEETNESTGQNDCKFYRAKGRPGFLVLSLQSSRPPEPVPWLSYPNLLSQDKTSYIDLRPVCYPAESVAQSTERTPTPIDLQAFEHIIKELNLLILGNPSVWHRA